MSADGKSRSIKFFLISAVIFIAVCIGITLLLLYLLEPKYEIYYNERLAECLQENNDRYYIMMIQKTGDTKYCSQLTQPKLTDLCSSEKKDSSVCNTLPETEKKICQAELQKNPSLCPEKDYWCMALASGDEKYCAQIQETETKKECITYVNLNADAFLSEEAKKDCEDSAYLYAAAMTQNKAACDKIINPEIRKDCLG
jgi:hypothetical protein